MPIGADVGTKCDHLNSLMKSLTTEMNDQEVIRLIKEYWELSDNVAARKQQMDGKKSTREILQFMIDFADIDDEDNWIKQSVLESVKSDPIAWELLREHLAKAVESGEPISKTDREFLLLILSEEKPSRKGLRVKPGDYHTKLQLSFLVLSVNKNAGYSLGTDGTNQRDAFNIVGKATNTNRETVRDAWRGSILKKFQKGKGKGKK